MKAVSGWWKRNLTRLCCFHLKEFLYFLIRFIFSALIILQKSLWGTLEIKATQHQKSGNLMTKNSHQKKTFLISLMRWLYLPTRFHPTRPDGTQLWAWNIIDAKSIHRLLPLTCSKCKCSSFWIFLLLKKQIFFKLNQISGKNTEDLKIKTRGFSKQKYYRSCY